MIKTFLLVVNTFLCLHASPILEVDVLRLKHKNGKVTVIRYIDIPADIMESVTLRCNVPIATSYKWRIVAKQGAPYVGSLAVGDTNKVDKQWERTLTHGEYPWELLVVHCIPKVSLETLITFVWVIMKMKSNTDIPYHPIICKHPSAQCVGNKFNCYRENGLNYRGMWNRAGNGEICKQWNTCFEAHDYPRVDAQSNHNFCRNMRDLHQFGKYKPFCFTNCNPLVVKVCGVPRCFDCMYGDGIGKYPDIEWDFPQYDGGSIYSDQTYFNKKGKKQYIKCHQPMSAGWEANECRRNNVVNNRNSHSNEPLCLAITDPKPDDRSSPHWESSYWDRLKWVRCVAPQCTVRQVWFLVMNADGELEFDIDNEKSLEVPVYIGRSTAIKFFHFGTTLCTGMALEGEEKVKVFMQYLELECNPTPQMSQIKIKQPMNELAGNYHIRYLFREGDPLIDSVEYKFNFKLVIKSPTTISLTPAVICPGYPTKTTAMVHGSFRINPTNTRWYYSTDEVTWLEIDGGDERFFVSKDGLTLQMNGVDHVVYVKLKVAGDSGDIETVRRIEVHALPNIEVKQSLLDAFEGGRVNLEIECNSNTETKWIFAGTIIDTNKVDSDYEYLSYVNSTSNRKVERLSIKSLKQSLEGIYTVEVLEDGCKNEKLFHVGIKN